MKCKTCGSALINNSLFCSYCGTKQNISPENVFSKNKKEPGISFVFITSLILMILIGMRLLNSLASLNNYFELIEIIESGFFEHELNTALLGLFSGAIFSITSLLLTFLSIIVLFIFAAKAKHQEIITKKIRLAKVIIIISLISMILSAIYLISEVVLFSCIQQITSIMIIDNIELLTVQLSGSILTVAVITGLLIVCVLKSIKFFQYLKKYYF